MTAPSPENLKTLFDFVCKGLDALEYKVLVLSLVDSYNHYWLISMDFMCKSSKDGNWVIKYA